jgi:exodeoxyribonuclease V gamma subunit
LADGLAETLLEPLEDPFTSEVVAVPTRGIERWLTQRLSTRLGTTSHARQDGVCANIEFPFPGRLIMRALAAATGIDPEEDPWLPERSVWPLLEVVDECVGEPWLATLERHLKGARGDPGEPPRRFSVVRHIADLFDRYGVHRPDMVLGWLAGQDGAWQLELWRHLRARIGQASPAERLSGACERIRAQPALLDLPPRISLFGLTRLPRSYVEVLSAIAARREVHVFVLHPSPALWEKVRRIASGVINRRDDPTATAPVNRLLASWGRDARELQLVLAASGASVEHHHELPAGPERPTLLGRVQADVRADREPGYARGARPPLEPNDHSIEVHSCHGRARQVEVLRDAILHLLENDPTLEPRDVIVMCPDIETFAPLIQATFGAGRRPQSEAVEPDEEGEPGAPGLPDLRVRLADRSLRQTNPLLNVVSQLLELADERATASQLLDLAAREPVRRRFGFDDDELSQMQDWVAASGVRWGFDAPHRQPFQLAGLRAGTWRKGLDRILTGVAMTEESRHLVAGVLPLDDVESRDIDLAGRLTEYVERTRAAVDALSAAQPVERWADAIRTAADALTAASEREAWQRRELDRILDEVLAECRRDAQPSRAELELADVRALLADRLRGRPTRANFRTGHLTICTLVPMRSVPHRVVCILGLDDGEFPRRAHRDGDDLMLHDPRVGDRDPRSEDRQMLLDALLAATERLIITYTGNDERTNARRPPAVPVGELLDMVQRTGTSRERVLVCHPLQPFDPRNFTSGALIAGNEPWGFDRQALAGARAITAPRAEPRPFLAAPLPPRDDRVIELDRLVRFVERPIRALLRDRLGITGRETVEEVQDALPVEIDKLEEWGVGRRLLEGVLAGVELGTCVRAEQARGLLPPGHLGVHVLEEIRDAVRQIAACAAELGSAGPVSLDVNLALPDGRSLAGTVAGVCGETLRVVSYSRVKPRDRLRAWVRLLALTAAFPDRPFESVVIGRARGQAYHADVTVVRISPLGDDPSSRRDTALRHLTLLIDLYDRGTREVLPLTSEASAAYAEAVASGGDGVAAARRAWKSSYDWDREDREPEHRRVFGGEIDLAELMDETPRADESGPGWDETEPTRFGRYARRLWDGLLAVEELSDR